MHTDRPLLSIPDAPETPRIVQIDDPAAGVEYILEPLHKIAHRSASKPRCGNSGRLRPHDALAAMTARLICCSLEIEEERNVCNAEPQS